MAPMATEVNSTEVVHPGHLQEHEHTVMFKINPVQCMLV